MKTVLATTLLLVVGYIGRLTAETNATHVFISVPAPAGNKFYRLRKP